MALDPGVQAQLDTANARGIGMAAVFAEQHMAIIVAAAQNDTRLLNGYLANQLFNESLVQSKAAYHSPVEPAAAPLPTPPAK